MATIKISQIPDQGKNMQAYVFKGPDRIFGVTAEPLGANLPSKYAPWAAFKTIDLQKGEPTPGIVVDECLSDLESYGFHVTDAHVRITHQIPADAIE